MQPQSESKTHLGIEATITITRLGEGVDDVYLFIHSDKNGFIFREGNRLDDFSSLKSKSISGDVYILSCHADGFAERFALQTNTSVVSTYSSVNYSVYDGLYYPRIGFADQFFRGVRWQHIQNNNGVLSFSYRLVPVL